MMREVDALDYSYCKWSCGITKSIQPGDRIFIVRLGVEPCGIVASRNAVTTVFEGANWDKAKSSQGKQ